MKNITECCRLNTAILIGAASALLAFGAGLMPASAAPQLHAPGHLRCEELETPLGIDTPQPRFSWQLVDSRMGAKQTAWQIQVASTSEGLIAGRADVWDSGRIDSDRSIAVAYAGSPLQPERRYFWRVKVWDKDGAPYPASDVTWWETGLMQEAWRAKWIGFEDKELQSVRESGAEWISNRGEEKYEH